MAMRGGTGNTQTASVEIECPPLSAPAAGDPTYAMLCMSFV